jgi:hypothetical protein
MEVFELAALMGAQTVLVGAHALKEELARERTKATLFRRATGDSINSVHSMHSNASSNM